MYYFKNNIISYIKNIKKCIYFIHINLTIVLCTSNR